MKPQITKQTATKAKGQYSGEAAEFWLALDHDLKTMTDSEILLWLRDGKHLRKAGVRAGELCAQGMTALAEGATTAQAADVTDLARALRSMCLSIDAGKTSPARMATAIREAIG